MTSYSLDLAEAGARLLDGDGAASVEYLTAEFEPFSSAIKPDLVFIPRTGVNAGSAFVIELRFGAADVRIPPPVALKEHRSFIQETSEIPASFAVATNASIDPLIRCELSDAGIKTFELVRDANDLATQITSWAMEGL